MQIDAATTLSDLVDGISDLEIFRVLHWEVFGPVRADVTSGLVTMVCSCGVSNFTRWWESTWAWAHEQHELDGLSEPSWWQYERYRDIVKRALVQSELSAFTRELLFERCERAMIAGSTDERLGYLAAWLCPVPGRT